jgi:predicted permease
MDNLLRDIRYSLRSLLKDKGFTTTVILTLAVCIAANTATFAVVYSVLLKPLPVPESNRILLMANQYPRAMSGKPGTNSSGADYYDRLRDIHVFEEQAMFNTTSRTVEINGVPERVLGMNATPSLFRLLRVSPAYGRAFTDPEGEIGAEQKLILSEGFAKQLFADPSSALGKDLRLNGKPFTVVGVMPAAFSFVNPDVRMWMALPFTAQQKQARHNNSWYNIGRLKPGATLQQAEAQMQTLTAANMERFPQWKEILTNAGFYTSVEPLQEMMVRDVKSVLYLLWGGALFVLLIGALNVTNLALARTALRRRELATRLALGAGPARLTRQLVAENVMLALAGGAIGAALGAGFLRVLSQNGLQHLPRASEIRVDGAVALVTLAMSLLVGVVLGLIPAWQVIRGKLNEMLREESRSGTGGKRSRRVRQTLVVAQVALAFVLLVGAGLLLASFRQLLNVDPGFATHGVLTAWTSAPSASYKADADVQALVDRSLEAIRAIPGVAAAGVSTKVPLDGNHSDSVILAEGYVMRPGESLISPLQIKVTPGYFEALNTAVVKGRVFDAQDQAGAPKVVIVDENLARHFWGDSNPIGKRLYQPQDINNLLKTDEHTIWRTVVGVVRAARLEDLGAAGGVGVYYFPYAQSVERGFCFAVRTAGESGGAPRLDGAGDTGALTRSVRAEMTRIAPSLALFDIHTMSERSDLSLASRRASMTLALGFGGLALFLAAIGIYGVLAYLVTQREREIGIRAALGCTPSGVVKLVAGEGFTLLGIGLVLGVVGAAALRNAVAGAIYGVTAFDPLVMASVVMSLAIVSLLACVLPARRATRVDPAIALRDE